MIFEFPLTAEQRQTSQLNYCRYCMINGASYMCLGETVVVLFATKLEASNTVIAVIGAMLFLGYLMLPLGVLRTRQVGAAQTQADFWVCRNCAAVMVASSALIALYSKHLAVGWLLLNCFLFYGCRAAGLVMAQPLIGDITTNDDRAKLLGDSNARFYIAAVCSLVTVSVILHYNDSISVLSCIIVAGAFLGVTSSVFIRKIHETSSLRESARQPQLPLLHVAIHDSCIRKQIWAGIAINLGSIMLASLSVATLKRGYHVSDTHAIIFSTVQFAAAIIGSKLTAPIAKRFGAKLLFIFSFLLVFPVCLFWLAMPSSFAMPWLKVLLFIPFFLIGAYSALSNSAIVYYFLQTVPKDHQVIGTMFIHVTTGVTASLIGMLASGAIIRSCEYFFGDGIAMFKSYFAAAFVFLLFWLIPMFRLDKPRN
ncbi:MAG: MFS transporter [Victivallales bacterium]|nr:MFS transporter [Victivallales bacterium]